MQCQAILNRLAGFETSANLKYVFKEKICIFFNAFSKNIQYLRIQNI